MNFIAQETEQKLRGGYYTPDDLARFLARWVAPSSGTRVLEPNCGDGAFFPSLVGSDAKVTAFELSPEEAAKAAARGLPNCTVNTATSSNGRYKRSHGSSMLSSGTPLSSGINTFRQSSKPMPRRSSLD